MKFYYFAWSITVPHKLNDSAEDFRRILQLDGVTPCFRKREPWRFSMVMKRHTLVMR